mmetsp:Transcript_6876/g.15785  ORF Transcript_6876/g.15785 Transcript_6876/m.15785 type:complete len:410 (-) Transcript_6876:9-1238(-)
MHRAITNPSRLPARRVLFATVKVLRRGLSDDVDEGNKHSDIQNSDDLSLPFRRIQSENDRILESLPVTFADISRAHVQIKGGVRRTPCEKAQFLSELLGANIYLKTELQQFTGSFKERGALNSILSLQREFGKEKMRETGVIAASAGNHALALSHHGKQLDVPVTVVMPLVAPLAKIDKCRKLGANVIIHGQHIGESKLHAEELMSSRGLRYINGYGLDCGAVIYSDIADIESSLFYYRYDDPPIIAGAGTIGVEIVEDVPEVEVVVVPVGGAGLIAGVSCAIKTLKPDVKVYGVEPEFAASYNMALEAGRPVHTEVQTTLADGLAVPMVGAHAFEVARHYVDECVTCTEKEVSLAILRLIENEKLVCEGGGVAGLAALLPGGQLDRPELKGKNIVIPLCGGDIDTTIL